MDTLGTTSETILNVLQGIGTIAFAVSGALMAGRRRMDWLGLVVLAVITAVGGGTLRDLLLGAEVFWLESPWYIIVAAVSALAMIPMVRWRVFGQHAEGTLQLADALGLAVFVIIGADKALELGTSEFVAVILGVITGVGGGIFRDVLAGRIPLVLRSEIYALAALIGATLYVLLLQTAIDPAYSFWLPVLLILVLRMASIFAKWSLPTFRIGDEDDKP